MTRARRADVVATVEGGLVGLDSLSDEVLLPQHEGGEQQKDHAHQQVEVQVVEGEEHHAREVPHHDGDRQRGELPRHAELDQLRRIHENLGDLPRPHPQRGRGRRRHVRQGRKGRLLAGEQVLRLLLVVHGEGEGADGVERGGGLVQQVVGLDGERALAAVHGQRVVQRCLVQVRLALLVLDLLEGEFDEAQRLQRDAVFQCDG